MSERLTKSQGEALVALLLTLRPDWGQAGVTKHLRALAAKADALTAAEVAVRFAARTDQHTPGLMAEPGPWWPRADRNGLDPRPSKRYDMPCPDHPDQVQPCPACRAKATDGPPVGWRHRR